MKEIRAGDNKAMSSHIVDCATKSTVYAGKDAQGPFLMVTNAEPVSIVSNTKDGKRKSTTIATGEGIKVYEKTKSIAMGKPTKDMTIIKPENLEISEQIKLPEKENQNIARETLIKEINNLIRSCQSYVEQMDVAIQRKNVPEFNRAKQNLEAGVKQLDSKMVQLTSITANKDPHKAVATIVELSNAVEELHRATEKNLLIELDQEKKKKTRENPYALHLKAMMDIKENLGQDEIRGTISNVNGVVQKEGFGDATRAAMNSAHKSIHEAGATAVRDDIDGPTPDTTFEDVDDLLTNGPQTFSPRFYGVAIEEAGKDERNRQEHGERTLDNQ